MGVAGFGGEGGGWRLREKGGEGEREIINYQSGCLSVHLHTAVSA